MLVSKLLLVLCTVASLVPMGRAMFAGGEPLTFGQIALEKLGEVMAEAEYQPESQRVGFRRRRVHEALRRGEPVLTGLFAKRIMEMSVKWEQPHPSVQLAVTRAMTHFAKAIFDLAEENSPMQKYGALWQVMSYVRLVWTTNRGSAQDFVGWTIRAALNEPKPYPRKVETSIRYVVAYAVPYFVNVILDQGFGGDVEIPGLGATINQLLQELVEHQDERFAEFQSHKKNYPGQPYDDPYDEHYGHGGSTFTWVRVEWLLQAVAGWAVVAEGDGDNGGENGEHNGGGTDGENSGNHDGDGGEAKTDGGQDEIRVA